MEKELSELLLFYTKRGKVANKRFIIEVIDIVKRYKNISDYLKDIKFGQNLKVSVPVAYSTLKKVIIVDYDKLYNYSYNKVDDIGAYKDIDNKLLQINLYTMQSILHDLEHVTQFKKCIENKSDDIATFLLKRSFLKAMFLEEYNGDLTKAEDSFVSYLHDIDELYDENKEYYISDPSERMAEINSKGTLLKIMSKLKNKYEITYTLINYDYLLTKIYGYNFSANSFVTPTQKFLKFHSDLIKQYNQEPIVRDITEDAKKLSVDDKLLCGLYLTREDREKVYNQTEKAKQKFYSKKGN